MVGDKHTSLSFLAFESWQGSENKMSSNKSTVAEIQPLYTSAGLNLGDRHLGEVERDSFITGHQGRSPGQLAIKRPEPPEGFQGKVFKDRVREGGCGECGQLVDLLLIGWW